MFLMCNQQFSRFVYLVCLMRDSQSYRFWIALNNPQPLRHLKNAQQDMKDSQGVFDERK